MCYVLESESAGQRVFRAFQSRFRVLKEAKARQRIIYHDTFDWRVHADGKFFIARPDAGQWVISLLVSDRSVLYQQRLDEVPVFAWDMPPGDFRGALTRMIEMRRLFPVADIEHCGQTMRVLDRNEKTVLRIDFDLGTVADPRQSKNIRKIPPRLRLLPVRGYPEARGEAAHFIEEELKLPRDGMSELELALRTMGRQPGGYSTKLNLTLDPDTPALEATRQIAQTLLNTIVANEAGTRSDLDTEFLHDFRVAVRRTRTCLAQIKDVFHPGAVEYFRGEFEWLGQTTGLTRDLDVYLLKFPDYQKMVPKSVRSDLGPLAGFLREHQHAEQRRLAGDLESKRYKKLIHDWRDFLEGRGRWGGSRTSEPPPANARRPIINVATERIAFRFDRVVRKGKKIDSTTPAAALHRLRIDCKKLRYLLEFFKSLYDRDKVDSLISALKGLQDSLGDFNDLQVQQETLMRFAQQMLEENKGTAETIVAMGRLVERLELRRVEERKRFHRRFDRFASPKHIAWVQRLGSSIEEKAQ
jgi:CHAD domain-containing protein